MNTTVFSDDTVQSGTELPPFRKMSLQYFYSVDGDSTSQTVHRTTQLIWEECGPCPVFASLTLVFALQLRKKHGKPSVRVAEERQLPR